jgi:hypothetical protein
LPPRAENPVPSERSSTSPRNSPTRGCSELFLSSPVDNSWSQTKHNCGSCLLAALAGATSLATQLRHRTWPQLMAMRGCDALPSVFMQEGHFRRMLSDLESSTSSVKMMGFRLFREYRCCVPAWEAGQTGSDLTFFARVAAFWRASVSGLCDGAHVERVSSPWSQPSALISCGVRGSQ